LRFDFFAHSGIERHGVRAFANQVSLLMVGLHRLSIKPLEVYQIHHSCQTDHDLPHNGSPATATEGIRPILSSRSLRF